jgi:recombinational DNA repair protein (RecF pathway)
MYLLHPTSAIIIKADNLGEADKRLLLMTADLGLLWARVLGARKQESKLRPFLQEWDLIDTTLVFGRQGWRLTSAFCQRSFYREICSSREKVKLIARFFRLILRLVQGESDDRRLFSVIKTGLEFLASRNFQDSFLFDFEAIWALRALHSLGYVGENIALAPFYAETVLSEELLMRLPPYRQTVFQAINLGIRESQL